MAAEDEGRTEEPSEYKIEKARKEGRVAKSHELPGSLALLLSAVLLVFLAKYIFSQCVEIMRFFFLKINEKGFTGHNMFSAFVNFFLRVILPFSLVGVIAAFAGNIIQTKGFIFSLKPIEPKFNKIVPKLGEYFRRTIGSLQGLFNIAKSLGKVALIVLVSYILIRGNVWKIVQVLATGSVTSAIGVIASTAAKLLIIVAVLFIVISIPDYFVQKHEFMESMKMTKQEQKEEFKEMEGDPEMKARLKQMQKDILRQNIPKAVKESDVVITNPTHFAVALKYNSEVYGSAPVVNAKGMDEQALLIKRLAKENDVPMVESRSLARDLYNNIDVGTEVPEEYFKTIVLIYTKILKK
ncbi:MAG: EscU/YscU/HrcU family type III secretion system export apparatus switch protein [Treponema sp.]|nr:EscU/YscU/HrcU family type III secretion system export apparatus switch protein [Treponema sp.]